MNVITLKPHRYKGKQKFPGDKYDFKGRAERRLAIALGWVKRTYDDIVVEVQEVPVVHDVEEAAAVESVADQENVAEPVEEEVTVPTDDSNVVVTYKPRRTYKRRDMVADE